VAFADRIILNKTDLVSAEELATVERRVKVRQVVTLLLGLVAMLMSLLCWTRASTRSPP
jgi:hypothetical protein